MKKKRKFNLKRWNIIIKRKKERERWKENEEKNKMNERKEFEKLESLKVKQKFLNED